MAQQTTLQQEIVDALGKSERFPVGSPQFELMAPQVAKLPDVIGEDHLDDLVTMRGIILNEADFLEMMIEDDVFNSTAGDVFGALAVLLFGTIVDTLRDSAESTEEILAAMGKTEAELILDDSLGLNNEAKQLYRDGKLTFRALVTTSPDTLIPQTTN